MITPGRFSGAGAWAFSLLIAACPLTHCVLPPAAAAGNQGQARAVTAAEIPGTDARLRERVCVHVTNERLSDLLGSLTKATGVTLLAHLEVADERVSYWADDRPLLDVMRDLRHLHGYYWSRAKLSGGYAYSLWQDAQSRAREEAEIQRWALKQQREFAESIQKHVRALNMTEAEIDKAGQDDPYLLAQMRHPVVRAGYQLFAALSPDQEAQLTQGQTPGAHLSAGEVLDLTTPGVLPDGESPDPIQAEFDAQHDPRGDIVTLGNGEMSAGQRVAVEAILSGAAVELEREAAERRREHPEPDSPWAMTIADMGRRAQLFREADRQSTDVTFFRWGDHEWQGLSMRVAFQSGGHPWALYSNIGVPVSVQKGYGEDLRKGRFEVWPGAQADVNRLLNGAPRWPNSPPRRENIAIPTVPPDPLLDAPISVTWALRLRDGSYSLMPEELIAALHHTLRQPIALDTLPGRLEQPREGPPEFRWEKRPLRELLQRLFPGWECHSSKGTLFLRDPERLRGRLDQVPRVVHDFLWSRTSPFTLDDLALVARSLSPWQLVRLELPQTAVDQIQSAQELLKLYGELAPAQRAMLSHGLPFTALTPPQQMLFLAFAERQRPYAEPWRFQNGGLRLAMTALPAAKPEAGYPPRPVSRAVFQVQFDDGDAQPFPVALYPPLQHDRWDMPVAARVGQPFPFPRSHWRGVPDSKVAAEGPALAAAGLRKTAMVCVLSWPFAEPYVSPQRPPDLDAWCRALAGRLQPTGVRVVQVVVDPGRSHFVAGAAQRLANLIQLQEPGDLNGQPFDSSGSGERIEQSPTVFVVDRDEIVRAVFEGQAVWDTAAVAAAARNIAPHASQQAIRASLREKQVSQ